MIDNLAIAAGTAVVTVIGTRWADSRRQLAGEKTALAAELRVQLAEAHRRGAACVQAMQNALDVADWDENDEPTAEFRDATVEFDKTLESLRSQASELLVRTPAGRKSLRGPITTMLGFGGELLRWMRYREIPSGWEDDEETFLQATTGQLSAQPELLMLAGAPQASPAALDPGMAATLRRIARQEHRSVYREQLGWLVGEVTGKNRREFRKTQARKAALRARSEARSNARIAEEAGALGDMKHVHTTFDNACLLSVHVESNVPQGGDAGHGGKTRLILTDDGGFAFELPPRGLAVDDIAAIEVLGDMEAHMLAEALVWAGENLQAITKANAESRNSSKGGNDCAEREVGS